MGDKDLRVLLKPGEEMIEVLDKAATAGCEDLLYLAEAYGWQCSVNLKVYHERLENFSTTRLLER